MDMGQLACPYHALFALYHEIGHVELYHLGYRNCRVTAAEKEAEADRYAFERLDMFDKMGQVRGAFSNCHKCMNSRSLACLGGLR
jgi:hypothetical protein